MTPNHGRPLVIHYNKFGLINRASLSPPPCHLNNGHGQTQVPPPLRDRAGTSDCTTKHRHRGFVPIQQNQRPDTKNTNVLRLVPGSSSNSTPFVFRGCCYTIKIAIWRNFQTVPKKWNFAILMHQIGSTNRFYHNQGHYCPIDYHTVVDFPRGHSWPRYHAGTS